MDQVLEAVASLSEAVKELETIEIPESGIYPCVNKIYLARDQLKSFIARMRIRAQVKARKEADKFAALERRAQIKEEKAKLIESLSEWIARVSVGFPEGELVLLSRMNEHVRDFQEGPEVNQFIRLQKINGRWHCDTLRLKSLHIALESGFDLTAEQVITRAS
jgi:hypothetical protein